LIRSNDDLHQRGDSFDDLEKKSSGKNLYSSTMKYITITLMNTATDKLVGVLSLLLPVIYSNVRPSSFLFRLTQTTVSPMMNRHPDNHDSHSLLPEETSSQGSSSMIIESQSRKSRETETETETQTQTRTFPESRSNFCCCVFYQWKDLSPSKQLDTSEQWQND
jgi:hypothetical protein